MEKLQRNKTLDERKVKKAEGDDPEGQKEM